MVIRALSIGAVAISVVATAATAADLTDRVQAERMTVVRIDQPGGRFQCAEHHRWVPVAKADLGAVLPGDIVRVERAAGHPAHLILLRTASEELASPEQ